VSRIVDAVDSSNSGKSPTKTNKVIENRQSKYLFFTQTSPSAEMTELVTSQTTVAIDEYCRLASEHRSTDPLCFWKQYEAVFPTLAKLAKKYLSVPASSAAVERMFSISGHIYSDKRRRMGVNFSTNLVWLKLKMKTTLTNFFIQKMI
jgi:hypothetical protein